VNTPLIAGIPLDANGWELQPILGIATPLLAYKRQEGE